MEVSRRQEKSGCGVLGAMFGRRGFWLRRSASTGSIPVAGDANKSCRDATSISKRRQWGSSDGHAGTDAPPQPVDRIVPRPGPNQVKHPPRQQQQNRGRRPVQNEAAMVTSYGDGAARKVPKGAVGISGELENIIADYQRGKGNGGLVRASSSNFMLSGRMGNLRQADVADHHPKYANSVMGNVVKAAPAPEPASLCRAISTRRDPETLKALGNEDFKNGRFGEALALYDAAISIDPRKASYRSNKSAALTAMGRILEAVFECREAIRIEPSYHRAHQRLGTLHLRLGEADEALYHYRRAATEADPDDIAKVRKLQANLSKCTDAKKRRDWNSLLEETARAISAGADSAPQIYALQAEALLKLRRHEDADEATRKGPTFDVQECTKFFGPVGNAGLLAVQAQVHMAAGRLDDALAAAQLAARLDSKNREVSAVARRARSVWAARSHGNELFKEARYSEACVAYGEGLDQDPGNSLLLCNRAACRAKQGHFEKAIDDCNAALNFRPSYAKARLRRADCCAKLGRWEASVQDYEMLAREIPGDDELRRGLAEARRHLRKQRGGEDDDGIVPISSKDRFRELVTASHGLCVVHFSETTAGRATPCLQFMEQLRGRYPSVSFFKVGVDKAPSLLGSEGVSTTPRFVIYRKGCRVKEMSCTTHESLESSIKQCLYDNGIE